MRKHGAERRNVNLWPVFFSILLTAYSVFTLLDAFVIPRDLVYVEELSSNESDAQNGESGAQVTQTSYSDDDISITITTLRRYETQVYVANVVINDASYLKTGLADGMFGRNLSGKTSEIAQECGAILAINGDYYGFRNSGFVMRNGFLYRESAREGSDNEDLVVYSDGSFGIINESETTASDLADRGAEQIFSFGPALINGGEITVTAASEVENSMNSNPRTAIGMIEPLQYILVVSDGRTSESDGLTLLELAQVMDELGCETAYNLDGGGSSTMWFMGEIVNNPTTNGRKIQERSVSDIVYIGK